MPELRDLRNLLGYSTRTAGGLMTCKLIHDISDRHLGDVPRRLRMLADELERDSAPVTACIIVVEFADGRIDIPSFGRDGDQMRALGLLTLANAFLTDSIIDHGRQDGRDPDAAA